jgi:hypothetical protein
VLEGDLVDSDGTVFRPGDFVSYELGTHHNSWTEGGCLLAVFSSSGGQCLAPKAQRLRDDLPTGAARTTCRPHAVPGTEGATIV